MTRTNPDTVYLCSKDVRLRISKLPQPAGCPYELYIHHSDGTSLHMDIMESDMQLFAIRLMLLLGLGGGK